MKLKTIMFFVSDINEAEHFYCDVLDLQIIAKTENGISFGKENRDFIAFKCQKNAFGMISLDDFLA